MEDLGFFDENREPGIGIIDFDFDFDLRNRYYVIMTSDDYCLTI